MELFLLLFSVFILGCVVGYRAAVRVHVQGFRHILNRLNVSNQDLIRAIRKDASPELMAQLELIEQKSSEEPREETVVEVKLEQHQGQIYAFRKDTDTFLAQGADRESLIERLNQTMKPCRVLIAREDGADLLQKNNT